MKTYFITGYPGFIGKRLVAHIAKADPEGRIFLLVQPKFVKEAQHYVSKLEGAPIEIFSGDIVDMHLGLSGDEYRRLCDSVTDIFHLAAISYLGMPRETAQRVNVGGTRNMLELARDAKHLNRFNHFSTAYVSGDRVGVIAEDELDVGQGFRNAYEETKFEAEKLVQRASATLPVTVYRPATVVGDSRTGEIDRFDGPYYLGMVLVLSPLVVPLPLPGNGVAPLNVVPVDYVVNAVWSLSRNPAAKGRTVPPGRPQPDERAARLRAHRRAGGQETAPLQPLGARCRRGAAAAGAREAGEAAARGDQLREPSRALQQPRRARAARRGWRAGATTVELPRQAGRLRQRALPQAARRGRSRRPARRSTLM